MRNELFLMETYIDMRPGSTVLNLPAGQWHSLKSLESGTVLLESKDGAYAPLGEEEDVMGWELAYVVSPQEGNHHRATTNSETSPM